MGVAILADSPSSPMTISRLEERADYALISQYLTPQTVCYSLRSLIMLLFFACILSSWRDGRARVFISVHYISASLINRSPHFEDREKRSPRTRYTDWFPSSSIDEQILSSRWWVIVSADGISMIGALLDTRYLTMQGSCELKPKIVTYDSRFRVERNRFPFPSGIELSRIRRSRIAVSIFLSIQFEISRDVIT